MLWLLLEYWWFPRKKFSASFLNLRSAIAGSLSDRLGLGFSVLEPSYLDLQEEASDFQECM